MAVPGLRKRGVVLSALLVSGEMALTSSGRSCHSSASSSASTAGLRSRASARSTVSTARMGRWSSASLASEHTKTGPSWSAEMGESAYYDLGVNGLGFGITSSSLWSVIICVKLRLLLSACWSCWWTLEGVAVLCARRTRFRWRGC